jgi:hypothetical protein
MKKYILVIILLNVLCCKKDKTSEEIKLKKEAEEIVSLYSQEDFIDYQNQDTCKPDYKLVKIKKSWVLNKPKNFYINPETINFLDKIAKNESCGSGNYNAIGNNIKSGMYKGQKALGRYQIMPANLIEWAKLAGVKKIVNVKTFLANPWLQDKIAAAKAEDLYKKYGSWADVAAWWLTGKPFNKTNQTKDSNGMNANMYLLKIGLLDSSKKEFLNQTKDSIFLLDTFVNVIKVSKINKKDTIIL